MTDAKPPMPPEDLDEPLASGSTDPAEARSTPPSPPSPPTPPSPADAPAAAPAPAPPPAAPPYHAYADPMAKSPGLALFLSIFFPGLGHIYVGAYERALMIIGGIAVSIWAMVQSEGRLWPLAFAIAFAYFYALFDAYREAQIANLADRELPKPRRQGEGRLMFGIFLTVVSVLVLADNLDLFDMDWFYDWWPAFVLLIGVYFIGSWIWERMNASGAGNGSDLD